MPINSIEGVANIDIDWDYAVLHGGMWTNVQNVLKGQDAYHGKDEPPNDVKKWPNCMYCVFLKDAKKGK